MIFKFFFNCYLVFALQEKSEVELELKLLEALEIYPPVKLGGIL